MNSASRPSRTLLVTGASRGIGLAISRHLLDEGWRVIGLARNFDADLHALDRFTPIEMDLSRLDELPDRLQTILREQPQIDGAVCNAGSGQFGSLEEWSPEHIRQAIDLNLTSHIITARYLLPLLKRRKGGDLVFMGSEAALHGGRKGSVYCAAKFGLRGLAQSLREECAGSGVRVGIVNPGMVAGEFFRDLDFRPGSESDQHLTPDDVAVAVMSMLTARPGAAVDELNLSPQKKVIRFD